MRSACAIRPYGVNCGCSDGGGGDACGRAGADCERRRVGTMSGCSSNAGCVGCCTGLLRRLISRLQTQTCCNAQEELRGRQQRVRAKRCARNERHIPKLGAACASTFGYVAAVYRVATGATPAIRLPSSPLRIVWFWPILSRCRIFTTTLYTASDRQLKTYQNSGLACSASRVVTCGARLREEKTRHKSKNTETWPSAPTPRRATSTIRNM